MAECNLLIKCSSIIQWRNIMAGHLINRQSGLWLCHQPRRSLEWKFLKRALHCTCGNFLQSHLGSHLLMKRLMCSPSIKHVTLTSELVSGYLLTCMLEADCPFTGFNPNRFTLQDHLFSTNAYFFNLNFRWYLNIAFFIVQIILKYVCYIKGFSKV